MSVKQPTTINKSDLIDAVSADTGISIADTKKVIDSTFEVITKTVSDSVTVNLKGFGTFSSAHRAARRGRNPHTGEVLEIAAKNTPHFKSAKAFKDAVNG